MILMTQPFPPRTFGESENLMFTNRITRYGTQGGDINILLYDFITQKILYISFVVVQLGFSFYCHSDL